MNLAQKLNQYFKLSTYNQVELSEKLGCNQSYLSYILNGKKNISAKLLNKFIIVLEIPDSEANELRIAQMTPDYIFKDNSKPYTATSTQTAFEVSENTIPYGVDVTTREFQEEFFADITAALRSYCNQNRINSLELAETVNIAPSTAAKILNREIGVQIHEYFHVKKLLKGEIKFDWKSFELSKEFRQLLAGDNDDSSLSEAEKRLLRTYRKVSPQTKEKMLNEGLNEILGL